MRVTIQFPKKIAEQVLGMPDRDTFVSDVVARALRETATQRRQPASRGSKWAQLVRRVESDPDQLGDSYAQFRRDMRDFRQSFDFRPPSEE